MINSRVWKTQCLCVVILISSLGIAGCPTSTPCPCQEGEQEGEGENQQFDIVGHWYRQVPFGGPPLMPWDTRNVIVGAEMDFFTNGKYTLAFREDGLVVASESGDFILDLDAQPPTLTLNPTQSSYPLTAPYSSTQNQRNPNLGVIEITNDNRYNLGFAGGQDDWGDIRPAGYSVADFRIDFSRQTKSTNTTIRLSDYLRSIGM
jgi:hypothetical protein